MRSLIFAFGFVIALLGFGGQTQPAMAHSVDRPLPAVFVLADADIPITTPPQTASTPAAPTPDAQNSRLIDQVKQTYQYLIQQQQSQLQLDEYKFKNYVASILTLLVVVFGLMAFFVMWRATGKKADPDQFLRSFIVVIIVIASLILITAGYSNEQVAPAFGLFGTIVGYMLGRLNQTPNSLQPEPPGGPGDGPPPPAPPPPARTSEATRGQAPQGARPASPTPSTDPARAEIVPPNVAPTGEAQTGATAARGSRPDPSAATPDGGTHE
jgi:hypothetical protein